MTTGRILKELRKSKGETRAKLAEIVGVSPSAIYQYEADIKRPRDEIKLRFADHFERSVEDIFFNRDTHAK